MAGETFTELVTKGVEETDAGNTLLGLMYLEKAARLDRNPTLNSYLGYCLARERRNFREGVSLCSNAVKADPNNLVFYRNLAKVYLAANQRKNALKILRQATKIGRDERVLGMIKDIGIRKEPVLEFLPRSSPINIYLGKLRERFFG